MDVFTISINTCVRVVHMPNRIFLVTGFINDDVIVLAFQSEIRTNEDSHVPTMYVQVGRSHVLLPESMAIRTRQDIGNAHNSTTLVPATIRKYSTRGIEFVPERSEYRWTCSSRHYFPTLLSDSRLLENFSGPARYGIRLVCLLVPGTGIPVGKLKTYTNKTDECSFDVFNNSLPASVQNMFLDYFIGPITSNQPHSRYGELEIIIVNLKNNIHDLECLSLCSIELRFRLESHLHLWLRIYYEVIRAPFPLTVLSERRDQWSFKDLINVRLARNPTCSCGKRSFLIHAFTQQIYCCDCFNVDMMVGKLQLSSGSEGKHNVGRFSSMTIKVISPFSNKEVVVYLTEDLIRNKTQTTGQLAAEPTQALELIHRPGVDVTRFQTNKKSCTLTSVLVHNKRFFEVLNQTRQVLELERAKRKKDRTKLEKHNTLLRTLRELNGSGSSSSSSSSTGSTGGSDDVAKKKKKTVKMIRNIGLVLIPGATVQWKAGSRNSSLGTVVEWLTDRCDCNEFYRIDIGTGSTSNLHDVSRDKLTWISDPPQSKKSKNIKKNKKRKR